MKHTWFLLMLIFIYSCRDKYVIPEVAPATGYLVVEGNINAGNDTSVILLSRSNNLTATGRITEERANVFVEGKDGSIFNFSQTAAGTYTINSLNIDINQNYRLHIKTTDGKDYASDYVPVKITPPVDSVSWVREDGGVRIYVNAHDDAGKTRYYLWDYQETWEIHSAYNSVLDYNLTDPSNPTIRYIDSSTFAYIPEKYACWVNRNSTTLNLGSTAKLVQDRVYLPLIFIPNAARELAVLYSTLFKQYALSQEAYDYLDKMRKNTESTGSIFDPQPSALSGNIHSLSNPGETVIGFVNISTLQERRLWIHMEEVRPWAYQAGCYQKELPNVHDSVQLAYLQGWVPTVVGQPPGITTFFVTGDVGCVDCSLSGSKIKPSFWP